MIVGTTENQVTPPSSTCCQNLLAEKRETMASEPPDTSELPDAVIEQPDATIEQPDAADTDYDWTEHRYVILIDTRKCIGCGLCVQICPVWDCMAMKEVAAG